MQDLLFLLPGVGVLLFVFAWGRLSLHGERQREKEWGYTLSKHLVEALKELRGEWADLQRVREQVHDESSLTDPLERLERDLIRHALERAQELWDPRRRPAEDLKKRSAGDPARELETKKGRL